MKTKKLNEEMSPKKQLNRQKTSLSPSPNKKRKNIWSKTQQKLKQWSDQYRNLPRKPQTLKLIDTKSESDPFFYYKYKDEATQLNKRSSLAQVSSFIRTLIQKSQQEELTSSEKYMLGGYIDVYIRESFHPTDLKDSSYPSIEKLKDQWIKLSQALQLYKIKITRCKINPEDHSLEEKVQNKFKALNNEIQRSKDKKQRVQLIKKLIRKFYTELIN